MTKQVKVTLGGREYIIEKLPIRQSQRWRQSLAEPFGEISQTLEAASLVEVDQLSDIAGLVRRASGVLLGSVDKMLDLLFAYSSALANDREYIETNAYDDEALAAFVEVLKLAYPLEQLTILFSGRTANKTSSSLPLPNGVSGMKVLGTKQTG